MEKNIFFDVGTQLTKEDLREFEGKFHLKLPEDFMLHYLEYNGGYPKRRYYKWANNEGVTRINTFDPIKYERYDLIDNIYNDLILEENYLPIGIIPFATDDGGNFFCISARENDSGFVYYCNNDHYNNQNKEECLTLLTKSFTEFLDSLVDK